MPHMSQTSTDRFHSLFLLVMLVVAEPALADQQTYPFKMAYRAEAGGQVVMVQNNGPALSWRL